MGMPWRGIMTRNDNLGRAVYRQSGKQASSRVAGL
tara:strand:+ start:14288 stop:14392 length:105 start_codon:yes stop_codon:yes gene_type:complete